MQKGNKSVVADPERKTDDTFSLRKSFTETRCSFAVLYTVFTRGLNGPWARGLLWWVKRIGGKRNYNISLFQRCPDHVIAVSFYLLRALFFIVITVSLHACISFASIAADRGEKLFTSYLYTFFSLFQQLMNELWNVHVYSIQT